jgi:hypothetical protein
VRSASSGTREHATRHEITTSRPSSSGRALATPGAHASPKLRIAIQRATYGATAGVRAASSAVGRASLGRPIASVTSPGAMRTTIDAAVSSIAMSTYFTEVWCADAACSIATSAMMTSAVLRTRRL